MKVHNQTQDKHYHSKPEAAQEWKEGDLIRFYIQDFTVGEGKIVKGYNNELVFEMNKPND